MQLELATIPAESALSVFTTPGAIDPFLSVVREALDTFTPDLTTKAGRKEIASVAAKVSTYKAALERVGADLAKEQKLIPARIDATRRHIKDSLDAMRDEVRQPLTEWEAAEDARIKAHEDTILLLKSAVSNLDGRTVAELRSALDRAEAITVGPECEEYEDAYARAKAEAVSALSRAIVAREKHDAEQAELQKLRREAAERAERDRIEQIRKDVEDRARIQAEAAARAEVERIEAQAKADKEAAERAAVEAERRAKSEAERVAAEAVRREAELRAEAERLARQAAETEARVRREAEEAAAREAAETARREADKKHRGAINSQAVQAIVASGITEETAKKVVTLIAKKSVPNVSISY